MPTAALLGGNPIWLLKILGVELAGGNAYKVMTELFVSNPEMIESAIEGHLLSCVPRFIFQRDQTRYDLVLEPIDEQRMKVHMNAHFEFGGITLPSQDQLQASFYEEYEYLGSILPRLDVSYKHIHT